MNSYYYGKSGKGDYTPDDLPKNRWQLFLEMLRTRMSGLCRMNLMYFVTWLPAMIAIALCVVSLIMTLAGTVQVDETGAVMDAIDQTALREAMQTSSDMIFCHAADSDSVHRDYRAVHGGTQLCHPQLGARRTRLPVGGLQGCHQGELEAGAARQHDYRLRAVPCLHLLALLR